MKRTRIRPRRIGPTDSYFDPRRFRIWTRKRYGTRVSASKIAGELGVSKSTALAYLRGNRPPTLESYLRMVASVREDVDVWLRHVEHKTDRDKRGES